MPFHPGGRTTEEDAMDLDTMSRRDLLRTTLAGAAATGALGALPRAAMAAPVTLEQLRKNGEMRIGVEVAYPPFVFRDKGAIVGYDVDLAGLFCKTLGVKPNFIDTQWSGVIPSLYAGRFDIIMASMTITKERAQRVAFSIPYAEASQALLVRQEDNERIKTIEDMSDRILGIKLGSPGEVLHKRIADRLIQAKGKGFKDVKTYDDHPAAYLALTQGTVDGVLNTLPTLAQVLKDRPGRYAIVRGVGQEAWAGIAARKEDPEIIAFLDRELARLKQNEELYRLQEKWFGFRMKLADRVPTFD
jgi:polar amino acid transport system substrate-binding protein